MGTLTGVWISGRLSCLAISEVTLFFSWVFYCLAINFFGIRLSSFILTNCRYFQSCSDVSVSITNNILITHTPPGKCIKDAGLEEGGMAAVGLTWEEAAGVCPSGVVPACHNAEVSSVVVPRVLF